MPYNQTESQKLVTKDVMSKFKQGKLKSDGDKVTSRKEAEAIAARESGSSKDVSPAENKRKLEESLKKKVDQE